MKKIFRKIHLWLSVPFGIFITLICFSGAMLVFEKEITELCRHDLYFVKEVKEKPLSIDSLMLRVSATLPDSVTATGITVSPDAEHTWQVSLSKPRRASLYVNPYTGEVTGRSERLPFYDTMFHLHRWMLGSSQGFGKLLVGVSTLMLVIILITGILMWLTNRKKPLRKSLTISFTKGWPRFWHDLHVAGGIYATIFLLAISLTGLTWSFTWYRTGFYGIFGVEASAGGHGGHGGSSRSANGGTGTAHGRNGRHGRPEHRRGNHDKALAMSGDTNTENAKNRRDRHHHDGHDGRNSHPAKHEAVGALPNTQTESTAQTDQKHNGQIIEKSPEHPHDNEEGTERRARHGNGRRGRYHHDGDSVGGYTRHHRTDSLRPHIAAQETSIAENRHKDSTQPSDAGKTVSTRKRNDRGRQWNDARKEVSRRNRPVHAQARQAYTSSVSPDTVATVEQSQASPFAHWQEVYDTLAKSYPGYRQITLSEGSASVVPAGRNSLRAGDRFDFDTESGKITGSTPYAEQDKSTHVRSAVYTVHVGSWGGLLTRIITFLAVLLGATLPITGYYLWLKRLLNKSKHKHKKQKA
ncbi:MAG: PepSY domain-containing protein [Prevotella sp.]|nr:PepSY domain-containing protein [Prevotella sp.]